MELNERQLWSQEQEVVLATLARQAGGSDCHFLEVGSWCGDSTLVLGRVAREKGGHVFCVDWWKGNAGTDLADIAASADVFTAFWNRIKRAGLEDVVVPIRGPSAVAAQILAPGAFALVFLDADHTYDGIRADLRHYAPLVRNGGIFCGHDCEGRISDFDRDFLEAGKASDFVEGVHCGVVLAVGRAVAHYSIDHAIWSARAGEAGCWQPTNLTFPGIGLARQPIPPPCAYSRSYNLVRYGRLVYAVPYSLTGLDIREDEDKNRLRFACAPSVRQLQEIIGEKVFPGSGPALVESYRGFNIIRHDEQFFGLAQRLGPLILPQLSALQIQKLQAAGDCVIGTSVAEVKDRLHRLAPIPPEVEQQVPPSVQRLRVPGDRRAHERLTGLAAVRERTRQRLRAFLDASGGTCEEENVTREKRSGNLQLVVNRVNRRARVSIILLDWGVRESFHSVYYLNRQTVPRHEYQVIWVEFYDRKPPELLRMLEMVQGPALDKWLVLGYPDNICYHKHRMYNAGIVLADGSLCVFCDSDAIFQPTFVASILKAFEERPNSVLHLDEVRNYSKRHYPFNYPALDEVLGDGCVNWTGTTTTGLDNSPDMVHSANYGACMAAWREDLLRIGGADEHIDYLGYICGPYELTFRLANFGREEHWLRDEYLYHVWHPNTSGCNVEYKGRDDGRGMSLPALEARDTGRIEPFQENPAIRALRGGVREPVETLLSLLVRADDGSWHRDRILQGAGPQLIEAGHGGFNILYYRGVWYALHQDEGTFDPVKVQHRQYGQCFSAPSKAELMSLLRQWRPGLRLQLRNLLRRVPLARRLRNCGRRLVRLAAALARRPKSFPPNDPDPHLVEEGYCGHNIVFYRGTWYGLGQDEGSFEGAKMEAEQYRTCVAGPSAQAVKMAIRRRVRLLGRMKHVARRFTRFARAGGTTRDVPKDHGAPMLPGSA